MLLAWFSAWWTNVLRRAVVGTVSGLIIEPMLTDHGFCRWPNSWQATM